MIYIGNMTEYEKTLNKHRLKTTDKLRKNIDVAE